MCGKRKGGISERKKIHVSKVSHVSSAIMGFSSIKYYKGSEKEVLLQAISKAWTARGTVSSFSGFCVASGKFDVFVASSHNGIWDIAPFIPIVEEAGGKVSDWKGSPLSIENKRSNMVVSNGLIHDEVIKMLSS